MKSLRQEHAQATRDAIVLAARKLFASKGYDGSSIDEIAATARVTSGALYHHFSNKRAIMRAVFETLEAELVKRVKASSRGAKDASDELRRGIRALLDLSQEDDMRSIVFQQAPRVLGWKEYRAIDEEYGIGGLLELLSRMRKEGKIGKYDHKVLALLLLALMNEAGFRIAANRNDVHLRSESERIIEAFLSGLEKARLRQIV